MIYKAIDVFNAAKKTYLSFGNECYAQAQAENFTDRCKCEEHPEDSPDQVVSKDVINLVVYTMLDSISEKVFWDNLNAEVVK